MSKDKMLWNSDKTRSVRASKIREIAIYPDRREPSTAALHTEVKGWYNANEYFDFGWFDTEDDARGFVIGLHNQIAA